MPEIYSAAQPINFNFGDIYPWVVGLAGLGGSTGNAGWTANNPFFGGGDSGTADAASTLKTANQFGPFTFNLDNLKTISFSQNLDPTAPAGARPVFNAGDNSAWVLGLAGLGGSTGNVGGTANNTFGSGDGGIADAAGTLQTANQLGPFVFDLNVLKATSFTQPPNGTTLPDGQLDNIAAVDIGRWTVGMPGVISNTGTTGFVTDRGYGVGFGTANWVGGLQTTTQIGPMTFDFNFLPAISAGDPPTGISFSMAPNLSSAGTPFAASDPPPPGTFTSDPPPTADPARLVSDPLPVVPTGDTPKTGTSRINTTTPTTGIPGVNGTPLRGTPKTGGIPGINGNPLGDIFNNAGDIFNNAIAGFTGTTAVNNPPTGGPGTSSGTSTGETG